MKFKICFVITFVSVFGVSSSSSKWILELGDNFADVHKDGSYWLVKFYTPWCGHCKRLEPIWAHVVQALKNTHIRVGRVDCTGFPNIAKLFRITSYPTIKLIKDVQEHTYTGDKNVDDIVNFAIRMSGPPVQHVTRPESLTNIKNMNQLFFMYVGDRKGPLWETYYDIASNMQAHAYYYSAAPDLVRQHVNIDKLPAIFIHKENSHYFYSVDEGKMQDDSEHLNTSMHRWINEERFETFPKITEGNFNEILQTKKYIVIVVVEDTKLQQMSKDMYEFKNLIESMIRNNRNKYHENFQFGWTNNHELANHIAMEILTLPALMVVNSTTLHHHVPEDDPTQMTEEAVELFLEKILNQSAPAYGGNNFLVKVYRTYFKAKSTLISRWKGNPVLTVVLIGLPFGFFCFILYSCCCADILDADDEDDEVFHEKRE